MLEELLFWRIIKTDTIDERSRFYVGMCSTLADVRRHTYRPILMDQLCSTAACHCDSSIVVLSFSPLLEVTGDCLCSRYCVSVRCCSIVYTQCTRSVYGERPDWCNVEKRKHIILSTDVTCCKLYNHYDDRDRA